MHRRDCLKIGAASVVGLVSLAGCMGPGGEEGEGEGGGGGEEGEGEGGGGGEEGEGGGEEDDIESNALDGEGNKFVSPE
jgi:hypothetical protein